MASSHRTKRASTQGGLLAPLEAKLMAALAVILATGRDAFLALQSGELTASRAVELGEINAQAAAMDQRSAGIVDAVGGAILSIAIFALLLNEVLGMDQFNMQSGPMSGLNIGSTAVGVFGILLLGVTIMGFVWIRTIWNGF